MNSVHLKVHFLFWATLVCSWSAALWLLLQQAPIPAYTEISNFTETQRALRDTFLEQHRTKRVVVYTSQETGGRIYQLPNKQYTAKRPNWLNSEGSVTLTADEKVAVAAESLMSAPKWMIWTDYLTINDYNRDVKSAQLLLIIPLGVVLGLSLGRSFKKAGQKRTFAVGAVFVVLCSAFLLAVNHTQGLIFSWAPVTFSVFFLTVAAGFTISLIILPIAGIELKTRCSHHVD